MKSNRTYRTSSRRAKKPHRRLLFTGFFSVILFLICIYSVITFSKNNTVVPSVEVASSSGLTLAKNAKLAWPTTGQAAIGSMKDGLLARSSGNEKQRPTASMAKVIAALAIMEKQPFKLGQTGKSYTLTFSDVANYHAEAARNGSVVPVSVGMELTQYQAMQAMLIASANNMADTLAEKTFGSEEAYVSYAQKMLQRMGLNQTVVDDASGFSPATMSTPSDLVAIGIAALKNPVIAEIVAQPQAYIPGVGTITNTNELLGTDGVVGLKTGTTDQAGSCLLFAADYIAKDGQKVTIVGVIMGDADAASLFNDSRELLASARQGFGLVEAQPTGDADVPPPMHRG
jgi:D-alanyl-D-alanine carboxypeptidase (penicillin-binding protein 5/6)